MYSSNPEDAQVVGAAGQHPLHRGRLVPGQFLEDRVVHLPGGLQVRRVALDDLPQDLDRQHRLGPFRRTVRRVGLKCPDEPPT